MPAIEGNLERITELWVWGGCFRLEMKGIEFYRRKGSPKENKKLRELIKKYMIDKEVKINYREEKTSRGDWILDRISGLSYGVPRKYLEVEEVILMKR